MGDGTEQNPYTREDVLKLIEENDGKAEGLDLSWKVFEEGINLSEINLDGVILTEARLFKSNLREASLCYADLQGAVLSQSDLTRAELVDANIPDALLAGTNLQQSNLGGANLKGANLRDAKLQGACFPSVQISQETNFERAKWGNYILDDRWIDCVFLEDGRSVPSSQFFSSAAETYRKFKIWHTNAGYYDIAGEFFFREMTAKRKALKWWPNPLNRAISKLISMLCGYGERPSNVVISALVVIFGLAAAYLFGGLGLAYSIYFSAVSFTALGYGNWAHTSPSNWVQGLGAFESFLGVFMIALFLVTFVRKMTR